jgi:hypothetical protein
VVLYDKSSERMNQIFVVKNSFKNTYLFGQQKPIAERNERGRKGNNVFEKFTEGRRRKIDNVLWGRREG